MNKQDKTKSLVKALSDLAEAANALYRAKTKFDNALMAYNLAYKDFKAKGKK